MTKRRRSSPAPILPPDTPDLLLPREVAAIFRVDRRTVTRWANNRWLQHIRTLGGHRRFMRSDVEAALREGFKPRSADK
jgi:excisionase family DNA binding protein